MVDVFVGEDARSKHVSDSGKERSEKASGGPSTSNGVDGSRQMESLVRCVFVFLPLLPAYERLLLLLYFVLAIWGWKWPASSDPMLNKAHVVLHLLAVRVKGGQYSACLGSMVSSLQMPLRLWETGSGVDRRRRERQRISIPSITSLCFDHIQYSCLWILQVNDCYKCLTFPELRMFEEQLSQSMFYSCGLLAKYDSITQTCILSTTPLKS